MKSNVCLEPKTSANDLDACIAIAWLDLVASVPDDSDGDDWLALCGDIDEGEIYREWFIWFDSEVSQEWEGYDLATNRRIVAFDLAQLKARIDEIEDGRNGEAVAS